MSAHKTVKHIPLIQPCHQVMRKQYMQKAVFLITRFILTSTTSKNLIYPSFQFERRIEPRHEKTGLRNFRPGPTQTGLYMSQKMARGLKFRI